MIITRKTMSESSLNWIKNNGECHKCKKICEGIFTSHRGKVFHRECFTKKEAGII